MTDANNNPRRPESPDERLNHAAEELITGDSDDPHSAKRRSWSFLE